MRGRRVVLLMTGVLPLLAIDDVPEIERMVVEIDDENDFSSMHQRGAAEKLHDDVLSSLPRLPLDVFDLVSPSSRIVVMDDPWEQELEFLNLNRTSSWGYCTLEHFNVTSTQDISTPTHLTNSSVQEIDKEAQDIERVSEGNEEAAGYPSDPVPGDSLVNDGSDTSGKELGAGNKGNVPSETDSSVGSNLDEEDEEGQAKRVLVDYASKSAGAQLLEKSPAMKGASNLLTNDNDKYAITPCSEKKYVVVGLSEDILVKQIRIANYERYSSHVKDFQVLGSQTLGQWVDLGTFTAKIGNGEQEFELQEPAWARYLKFRFMTHYRDEHYCTLSQIKVHGSTMLQGFHEQWTDGEGGEVGLESDANDKTTDEASTAVETEKANEVNQNHGTNKDAESPVDETHVETKDEGANQNENTEKYKVGDTENDSHTSTTDLKEKDAHDVDDVNISMSTRPLPPIFDIYAAQIPFSLTSSAFELSSLKSINEAHRHTTEKLDTVAIPPESNFRSTDSISKSDGQDFGSAVKEAVTDAVKAVVAEASGTVQKVKDASAVSDAVRELQNRIQTTIGKTWELQHSIHTMIGKSLPALTDQWVAGDEFDPAAEVKTEASIAIDKGEVDKSDPQSHQESVAGDVVQNDRSTVPEPKVTTADDNTIDAALSAGLAEVIKQYPSAKCLESLHFPDFRKSITDKMATGSPPSGSASGKMEPIFKTLTDQIKALQISKNVHDQFSRALITCYQNIMVEMATDLRNTQIRHEERFSRLEAEMKKMKSRDFLSVLASGVVYVLSLCLSVSVVVYLQAFRFMEEAALRILDLKHGSCILSVIVTAAAIITVICARCVKRERDRTLKGADHRIFTQSPVRRHSSNVPVLLESPVVKLPRTRSLQFFPSE